MSTKGKTLRLHKTVAALAVFALAASACGSDAKKAVDDTKATASSVAAAVTTAAPAPAGGIKVIVATDLPLQGASKDASDDTNKAIELLLEQTKGKAGKFTIELKKYDNSTAAKGSWDDATCAKNAQDHVANKAEVAVMGTYNSGCAKIEIPVLNEDKTGPMLMISHANTNPGITKAWDPGEPAKYYPTGKRNYGRVVATDDLQGAAGAGFAGKDLKVTKCVVLNDAQTYGVGVAKAFEDSAKANGITVVATKAWDAKQPNYTALFESFKALDPDCVYLGGINDNNGEQLIRDKVAVLGPNTGKVKLIAPDGFTGYPTLLELKEADQMYVTFAGLPVSELLKAAGAGAKFAADYKTKYGKDPASAYASYGAAAMQLIMKAIEASDGTRASVTAKAFEVKVSAAESVIGKEFSLDKNGDVTAKDMSIQQIKEKKEVFLKAWPL